MKSTSIKKTIIFKSPRNRVWEYLTDKDKLGEWYHPAESNLKLGEEYSLFRVNENDQKVVQISGCVLEMDKPSKLVTTFIIDPFQGKETIVTWILEDIPGGTQLSLIHTGISNAAGGAALDLLAALDKGWDAHLSDLRDISQ